MAKKSARYHSLHATAPTATKGKIRTLLQPKRGSDLSVIQIYRFYRAVKPFTQYHFSVRLRYANTTAAAASNTGIAANSQAKDSPVAITPASGAFEYMELSSGVA